MGLSDTINDILGKTTVQAILGLIFGIATICGFLKGMISEDNFIDLVKIIIIFFFTAAAISRNLNGGINNE